jgi:hypothetical protein
MAYNIKAHGSESMIRWTVIIAIAVAAFFGSYRFAQAAGTSTQTAAGTGPVQVSSSGGTGQAASGASGSCCAGSSSTGSTSSGSSSGSCCGAGSSSATAITKKATVSGDLQKVSVDLSKGYYDPNTIQLKAGVPAEITFGQGSGCLSQVQSQQLGFFQDLTKGAVAIKLPALTAGTYTFTCGMQMQSGTIVVK